MVMPPLLFFCHACSPRGSNSDRCRNIYRSFARRFCDTTLRCPTQQFCWENAGGLITDARCGGLNAPLSRRGAFCSPGPAMQTCCSIMVAAGVSIPALAAGWRACRTGYGSVILLWHRLETYHYTATAPTTRPPLHPRPRPRTMRTFVYCSAPGRLCWVGWLVSDLPSRTAIVCSSPATPGGGSRILPFT